MLHTPGPWHWVDPITDKPISGNDFDNASLRTVEEFGENKTEEIDGKNYTSFRLPKFVLRADVFEAKTKTICSADAHMIAAAPELCDALDDLVMAIELPGDHCEVEQAMRHAKTALAKVRGGCPQ